MNIEVHHPRRVTKMLVIREGVATADGRTVERGATTWIDEPLPVILMNEVVTTLTNIRREGDDIVADTETVSHGLALGADVDNVEATYNVDADDVTVSIHACRLRGAHIIPAALSVWPDR